MLEKKRLRESGDSDTVVRRGRSRWGLVGRVRSASADVVTLGRGPVANAGCLPREGESMMVGGGGMGFGRVEVSLVSKNCARVRVGLGQLRI